jgi:hypothetical protein
MAGSSLAAQIDPDTIPATVQVVQLPPLDPDALDREPDVLDNYTPTIVELADGIRMIGWLCQRKHDEAPGPTLLVLAHEAAGGGVTQATVTLGEMAEQLGQHEEDEHGGSDEGRRR